MCGICGKLNFDSWEPPDPTLIRRMMELLHHRGPDGGGLYCSGPVALGHRRLSIIDLETGSQPMSNEDGTVWVVYNGEIYNFQELRSDLEGRGHRFMSSSDTEVIIHLYEEVGEDAVAQLRGMFAFALWDERKQSLLLARDRVGVKPLYYTNTGRALVFASEIKSLLADRSVMRTVNPAAIDRFLTYYYLPGSETLLKGVYKLEPGNHLTVSKGQVVKKQYWDLCFEESPKRANFDEAVESLKGLLRTTVKDHMISDVPVGVLLSGGVDSTGVLRYAVEETQKPVHTFTIGFSGEEFVDERPYARLAAKRYGTVHQDITMTARDFLDFLPGYVWHMEEPICEPPAIALFYVSKLARESSVRVLLSGEGGDEAFGGYQNYRNLLLLENLKSVFGPARILLRAGLGAVGRAGWNRAGRYSSLVDQPLSQYYLSRTATPDTGFNRLKGALFTREFSESLGQGLSNEPTRCLFENLNGQSPLNHMLYVDTKTWLPDDLLVKADKMTMATSVELRVPLLDFRVLEFAASLPASFKVRGWTTKRILKAALGESVPREILIRKKTGFPVPYGSWMRNGLKSVASGILMDERTEARKYFRATELEKLLDANSNGVNFSKEIFSLLILELWLRQFIDQDSSPETKMDYPVQGRILAAGAH